MKKVELLVFLFITFM